MPYQINPQWIIEVFDGEDVNKFVRFAFRIMLMDPEGEHFGYQCSAESGSTEQNVGITVADVIGYLVERNPVI